MTHTHAAPLDAVDLFAGPGGWDVAAQSLDLNVLGIEWDHAACETRRAAGLPTVEGDVRQYGPADFPARGFIASPPCQTFSMAGGGAGRRALDVVLDAAKRLAAREAVDPASFGDERTALVLEPLRWALEAVDAGTPYEWLAFEQVPTVLPVWEAFAELLRAEGYSVAVGRLSSEQYGVPQTRKRAILVARLHGEARLPAPTHRPYKKGVDQADGDPVLLPWVSMAEALGWAEPRVVVSNYGTGGDPARRGERLSVEPAAAVTSKVDRNRVEPWGFERPSTTIVGSFRPDIVAAPGWRKAGDGPRQNAPGSVRVSAEEAAVLQSFPADHPWQGSKTKVFQQIGNAVPPLLARAVLCAAAGVDVSQAAVEQFGNG